MNDLIKMFVDGTSLTSQQVNELLEAKIISIVQKNEISIGYSLTPLGVKMLKTNIV